MPWPPHPTPRYSHWERNASQAIIPASLALVLIDVAPLRHAAWSEFHAARKAAEKAARDLHRHEETDTPSYERWLHGAFPQLVTTLRELHAEVLRKARDIDNAQFMAAMSGRSVKKVWKDHKYYEANPGAWERDNPPEPEPRHSDRHATDSTRPDDAHADDDGDFFKDFFADDDFSASKSPRMARFAQQAATAWAKTREEEVFGQGQTWMRGSESVTVAYPALGAQIFKIEPCRFSLACYHRREIGRRQFAGKCFDDHIGNLGLRKRPNPLSHQNTALHLHCARHIDPGTKAAQAGQVVHP